MQRRREIASTSSGMHANRDMNSTPATAAAAAMVLGERDREREGRGRAHMCNSKAYRVTEEGAIQSKRKKSREQREAQHLKKVRRTLTQRKRWNTSSIHIVMCIYAECLSVCLSVGVCVVCVRDVYVYGCLSCIHRSSPEQRPYPCHLVTKRTGRLARGEAL